VMQNAYARAKTPISRRRARHCRASASRREPMKKLKGGAVLLFLVGGTGSGAQAAPWCAFYDASTYNCGFHTFEQCLATVRGAGGWCRPNFFEGSGGAKRPAGRRTPGARY
jgi:hypothetical protein